MKTDQTQVSEATTAQQHTQNSVLESIRTYPFMRLQNIEHNIDNLIIQFEQGVSLVNERESGQEGLIISQHAWHVNNIKIFY